MTKRLFSILAMALLVLFAGNLFTAATAQKLNDRADFAGQNWAASCNHCFGAYRYTYNGDTGAIAAHSDAYLLVNPIEQFSVSVLGENGAKLQHYHQLESPVVLAYDKAWAVEYTYQGANGFAMGAYAENTTDAMLIWHREDGSVCVGYVQHHALTAEEQQKLEAGDKTIVAYTWHYWTFDASELELDEAKGYTYRIENDLAADGKNRLRIMVFGQDQILLETELNRYYTHNSNEDEATLQNSGVSLSGKDLVIHYLGTKDFPLSGMLDITLQEDVNAESFDAMVKEYRNADCDQPGGWEQRCGKCGYAEFTEDTPALGHSYGEFVTVQDATCEEEGRKIATCANCGDEKVEAIPALGHAYGEFVPNHDETCEENGTKTATCINCGDKKTEQVPAIGHNYGDYVSNHDASCTKNGTKTAVCMNCGHENTVEDPNTQLPHAWLPATCEAAKTCADCGATEGKPLPHTWEDATCLDAKYCLICGVKEGKALGHDWSKPTCLTPATCSRCAAQQGELGKHAWIPPNCTEPETCSVCGTSRGVAKGHRWKNATCVNPKTCRNCSITEGEPLGHDWVDATCTEPQSCSRCPETVGEPLGHNWIAASCTEKRSCGRCQMKDGQPLGHSWKEATCTDPKTCTVCSETEGDPLGHTWVDATCTEPMTCSACAQTQGEPLGHAWEKATCTEPKYCPVCQSTEGGPTGHRWKEATCTEPAVCEKCNLIEGDALGHDWKKATCTTPETCGRCTLTQGASLGHKWQNATCTDAQICSVCKTEFGSPLGHVDIGDDKVCDRCGSSLRWESDQLMSWIIPLAIGLIAAIVGYIVYAEMRAKKRSYYKR